jgi:hypothetical protein
MARRDGERLLEDDPRWYQDAIIYQLHVRAFLDSDGNGIGDFRGLTEKLDYLQDLGVNALWLLPFFVLVPVGVGWWIAYSVVDVAGLNRNGLDRWIRNEYELDTVKMDRQPVIFIPLENHFLTRP